MIRVGFSIGVSFLGSVNYYRNLINAIWELPDRQIQPVFFIGKQADEKILEGLHPVEVIRTDWFDQFTPRWAVRKASQHLFHRDPLMERFLKKHRIDVLSHSDFLGKGASIPAICWIGDFQHRNQPQYFTALERWYRDHDFRLQARYATRVILSSHDAQRDLEAFDPSHVDRSRVLQFVSRPSVGKETTDIKSLQERYHFSGSYFHLPNQFWAHKNHRLVLDALCILKEQGNPVLVLSTGSTEDYRRPKYFSELMAYAAELDVLDCFRVLGIVPYNDLIGLMVNSVALINPSRAEGWSTPVEEAKSLGKRIILSNLPVHLEQNPLGGVYVGLDDPSELASAMMKVLETYDQIVDSDRMEQAKQALPGRIQSFAKTYQDIVLEAISPKNGPLATNSTRSQDS